MEDVLFCFTIQLFLCSYLPTMIIHYDEKIINRIEHASVTDGLELTALGNVYINKLIYIYLIVIND